ncbi:MAG: DNA (cytosine-5-)-methyltransferase [Desulfuromonadales bacterium]|nr:DNA (cytosine-5-)-methyltransferase [Desulfuromonadales bacterium]
MKVLSLFDGMSGGMIALERAGIEVDEYYASEVDKHAQIVSEANYPQIKRLGDVQHINYQMLPEIDLLIGGSPCQGFSFAGKQLNFSDSRSALFFEFIHALKTVKPKYFMLENVVMKQEFQDAISDLVGCKPIKINSALVSAQNRNRLYWTNIPGDDQPEDRGIVLSDILEQDLPSCGVGARVVGRRIGENGRRDDYNHNIPISQYLECRDDQKSNCMTTVYKDSVVPYFKTDKRLKVKFNQTKSSCLTGGANSGGNHSDMYILVIDPDICRRYSITECERLQTVPDGYTQNKGASNSQCYKMLGNGWTVDVISHIFKGLRVGFYSK